MTDYKALLDRAAAEANDFFSNPSRLDSLLRILLPLGYTLRIEPLENDAARL